MPGGEADTLLSDDWQAPNSNTMLLDHNNAAEFQAFPNWPKICQEERQLLFRSSFSSAPKKDNGRFAFLPLSQ